MKRLLITGANGFVGSALCEKLIERGFETRGAVRKERAVLPAGVDKIAVGDIGAGTEWSEALKGIDCVIHLAARVHVMTERSADPLSEFRKVNVEGTKKLALSAVEAGVKRLVYVSSVKVNGEATFERPFSESDEPNPQDPYGVSKWEAEEALRGISEETGLEVAIVRPPLVYGAGVGGNFVRMLSWISKGIPLPLGSVKNHRSMIYVENLADALIRCATHPNAANEIFLASDRHPVSTPELIRILAGKMGRRSCIVPCPVLLLKLLGKLTGKSPEIERLTGTLVVDTTKIRTKLGWTPPYAMLEGMEKTVAWYDSLPRQKL